MIDINNIQQHNAKMILGLVLSILTDEQLKKLEKKVSEMESKSDEEGS